MPKLNEYCNGCPRKLKAAVDECEYCVVLAIEMLERDFPDMDLTFEQVEYALNVMSSYWDKNDKNAWRDALNQYWMEDAEQVFE